MEREREQTSLQLLAEGRQSRCCELSAKLFQIDGPVTGKARPPAVESDGWNKQMIGACGVEGTTSKWVSNTNQSIQVGWCGSMYISMATLNVTVSG